MSRTVRDRDPRWVEMLNRWDKGNARCEYRNGYDGKPTSRIRQKPLDWRESNASPDGRKSAKRAMSKYRRRVPIEMD